MPGLKRRSLTSVEGTAEEPARFEVMGRGNTPIDLRGLLKDDLGEQDVWDVFDTEADWDHRLDPAAGHGGFIADIIARIAPKASITVVRVLGQLGAGDELKVAQILHKVVGHFDLVSLSFGTYTPEMPWAMAQAVRTVQRGGANGGDHPAVIVASAGNDGTWLAPIPAALPDVVSVAALDWHEQGPAPFSNYGPWVSACAPGTDIEAAFWDSTEGERLWPGAASWSGTSFAAPYVVGALARTMRILDSDPVRAVERLLHAPGLVRLPMHGTVVRGFLPQAPPPSPQASSPQA
jgi:subtilisin family serine protease